MGRLFNRGSMFALTALAATAFASPSSAATNCTSVDLPSSCYINYVTDVSGTFGNTDPKTYPSHFIDTFTFDTTAAKLLTIELGSSWAGLTMSSNLNFVYNGVTVNGTVIPATLTGITEQRYLANFRIPAGLNTIIVKGASQPDAIYAGLFTLSGVPEPTTWAMMLLGVGFAGGALRNRRRQTAQAVAMD